MSGHIVSLMRDAAASYRQATLVEHRRAMQSLRRRSCAELCAVYNRATNPSIFRTELRHRRAPSLARAALYALRRNYLVTYHYRETASGRMEAACTT